MEKVYTESERGGICLPSVSLAVGIRGLCVSTFPRVVNCDFTKGSSPSNLLCLLRTPSPALLSYVLVPSKLNHIPPPFLV